MNNTDIAENSAAILVAVPLVEYKSSAIVSIDPTLQIQNSNSIEDNKKLTSYRNLNKELLKKGLSKVYSKWKKRK